MKKNILLFISIVVLLLSICFFQIHSITKLTIGGKELTKNIYEYKAQTEISDLKVINNIIYFLTIDNKLYKEHIFSKESTLIGEIPNQNSNCILENKIYCYTETETSIYDYNLKEQTTFKNSSSNTIAPFKDTYTKLNNKDLTIINNSSNKFRTLKENFYLEDFFYLTNNTFLILNNTDKNYLYNINNNTYEKVPESYYKYSNGFYFLNDHNIIIHDLINAKTYTYEIPSNFTLDSTISLSNNSEILYLKNPYNNDIEILNLKTNTIKNITIPKDITNIYSFDSNYLYMLSTDSIILLDLENLNLKEYSLKDYLARENETINRYILDLKNKYNVNINIKKNAILNYPDFTAKIEDNNKTILNALNNIDTILNKYNKSFFDYFYEKNYEGLNIYLTGELAPVDYDNQISNPAAYSLIFDKKYTIVIDIREFNIKELFCHELLHNIEYSLSTHDLDTFIKWNLYNPKEFLYNNSYTEETTDDFTLNEDEPNNVYFIDEYSKTFSEEDRSRVFEKICSTEKDSLINDYPHLYQKALYLKEEILKNFPTLKNSSLFNSLN